MREDFRPICAVARNRPHHRPWISTKICEILKISNKTKKFEENFGEIGLN